MGSGTRFGCRGLFPLVVLFTLGCSQDSGFAVGDSLDGGEIVAIEDVGDCSTVTVEYQPDWQCSAEQLALVQGFGSSPSASSRFNPDRGVSLQATDCDGLADRRRTALKASQQSTLDRNRRTVLGGKCVGRRGTKYFQNGEEVGHCSGSRVTSPGDGPAHAAGNGGTFFAPETNQAGGDSGGADKYSTTNNQVAGVDEADYVKNDSGHVYVLSSNALHVIDAWPASESHEIAKLSLRGEPRRLFLAGQKLVVYTRLTSGDNDSGRHTSVPSDQGCTYGYDCRFVSEGGHTSVTVFDVSNPAQPVEQERYELSGGYVASRRIGSYIYTVVHDGDIASPPDVTLTLNATSPEELDRLYAERKQRADEAVDSLPASQLLPRTLRVDRAGSIAGAVEGCDSVLASPAAQGTSFLSLISFDLNEPSTARRTLVAAKPGFVYASARALYFSTDGVDGSDVILRQSIGDDASTIHKFALSGLDTPYRGSAVVRGHVLNQFSMDEFEDVLRVATSSGFVPDPDASSNLTTLAERDGSFQQLGHIGNIAPQEDIRSVRFDGTRGFVVTFKKTDPLFAFDLSDPSAPAVLGELKIPGFSTYMHPLDHDHLLAVGFDADDQGAFAYFDGIQLQIFDVTDLSRPLLMHKTVIGTRGSGSEALTNHLAFNYFPARRVLALPMTVCEGGDQGAYSDELTFSGLMVFNVSLETGITEQGRMPFVDAEEFESSGRSCQRWWSKSTSGVKRSIFMDDYAIGISDTLYQVAPLADLSAVLRAVPLAN